MAITTIRPPQQTEADATRSGLKARLTRRLLGLLVAAMVAMLTMSQSAFADSWGYGSPTKYNWAGCSIQLGPVYMAPVNGKFDVIGGAGLYQCSHQWNIEVWVREYFSPSGAQGTFYQVGNGNYTLFSNSYGMNTHILETNRICGNGYWQTDAFYRLNGTYTSGWVASSNQKVAATLC